MRGSRPGIAGLSLALFLLASPLASAETWSRAYVESLPDSAFAAVETDPLGRPVRHLPHHDQNGRVDIPHLKSARARLSQVKWHDPKNQAAARAHLDEHWWEYQRLRARDKGLRGPVDLNSAPLEELVKLPGIGEKTARAILDYREAHGGFRSVNELRLVRGIGPKTFKRMEDLVTDGQSP